MENDQGLRRAIISLVNASQFLQCHARAASGVLSALPSSLIKGQEAMTGQRLEEHLSKALAANDYLTKQQSLPVLEALRNGSDAEVGLALQSYAAELVRLKL
jgi:hypothetical protein